MKHQDLFVQFSRMPGWWLNYIHFQLAQQYSKLQWKFWVHKIDFNFLRLSFRIMKQFYIYIYLAMFPTNSELILK